MERKYLISLTTGVVLPFCHAALKSSAIREATAEEAANYEATLKKPVKAPKAKAKRKAKPKAREGVVTQDFKDGEPNADEIFEALRVE